MVLALVVLLGFAGLVIDIGRVYVAQRQLQAAVDAAALAAGQDLPDSVAAHASAISYGATGSNREPDMEASAPVVSFKCLQTLVADGVACQTDSTNGNSAYCTLSSGCNAVQVTESASVKTTLLGMFLPRFSAVSATSTVSAHGGRERPLDVMVVLDTTGSMRNDAQSEVCPDVHDPSKLDCAKAGVLTLLDELEPCATQSCTSSNALDRVGLMAFPPLVNSNLRSNETGGPGTHSHGSCTLSSSEVSYDDTGTTTSTSTVTPTGTTSSGSKTISSVSSVTGIQVGSSVSGSGIPSGTTVTAVSSSHSTVTISKSATSSRSHVTLTFSNTTTTSNTSTDPTASGSYTYTVVPLENSYATRLGGTWQLNTSDPLVAALSTSSSCSLQALSSSDTSFATAIDQAQAALAAEDDWSTHDHAIVFLGDGEANYGPIYMSPDDSPGQPVPVDAVPAGGRVGRRSRRADHFHDGNAAGRHHDLCDRLLGEHERPGHQLQRRRRHRQPRSQLQRRHRQLRPDVRLRRHRPVQLLRDGRSRARPTRPAATRSLVRSPAAGRWRTSRATRARSSRTRATPTSRRSSARSPPT